jgi:hypothetical protein
MLKFKICKANIYFTIASVRCEKGELINGTVLGYLLLLSSEKLVEAIYVPGYLLLFKYRVFDRQVNWDRDPSTLHKNGAIVSSAASESFLTVGATLVKDVQPAMLTYLHQISTDIR